MNRNVCVLGTIIIVASGVIMVQSETYQVRSREHELWTSRKAMAEATFQPFSEPEPPYFTDVRIYPYLVLGAIIFLVGFVTFVIGYAMEDKVEHVSFKFSD